MPGGLRASDADRDACVETLEKAYADGRLNDIERQHRVEAALAAITQDDLARLTRDLDPTTRIRRADVATSSPTKPTTLKWILILVILLAAMGIVITALAVDNSDPSSTHQVGAASTATPAPRALHTVKGFTELVEAVKAKFGSTEVTSMAVYADYASVTVPVAGSENRTEMWFFRGKFADEPSSRSSRSSLDGPNVDIADLDVAAMMAHLKEADRVLNVADAEARYILIDSHLNDDESYSIYVSNEYSESGYIKFRPDGSEIERYPFTAPTN